MQFTEHYTSFKSSDHTQRFAPY